MKLLVDPMLMSGRWCFFIFIAFFLASAVAEARPRERHNLAVSADQLARDQEKIFALSGSSRAMPSANWFVATVYDRPEPSDPMQTRWVRPADK